MDVIQEVGAYAGFAAVVGLAVLAALFFSQARDLRRLREWAGRAPERAAEQAVAQPAVPPQPAPSGAVRPIPAAKPAQAAAAQTGAGAAVATAKPATAAANAAATVETKPGEKDEEKKDEAKPGEKPEAKPGEEKKDEDKKDEAKTAVKPVPGAPATAAKPAPATAAATPATKPGPPVPPARPPAIPSRPAPVGRTPAPATASQSTAVLPASARVRDLDRPDRRGGGGLEGRYIALIVAGVLVVGAGIAFGVSQLGGEDDAPSTGDRATRDSQPAGPLNRSLVTVSVLNGTTVPGLAAQIGDEVESKGFQRGNVANAIDQQRQDSVVLFAEGGERPARVVARVLGISGVEPVDPDSQALAGNASVVVVVGADQTQ